jgi:hypothetical protein
MEDKIAAIFAVLEHFAEAAQETGALQYLQNLHGPDMTKLINEAKSHLAGDWRKRFEPPANDVIAQLRAQIMQLKSALEVNSANGARDAIVEELKKQVQDLHTQVLATTKPVATMPSPAGGNS